MLSSSPDSLLHRYMELSVKSDRTFKWYHHRIRIGDNRAPALLFEGDRRKIGLETREAVFIDALDMK